MTSMAARLVCARRRQVVKFWKMYSKGARYECWRQLRVWMKCSSPEDDGDPVANTFYVMNLRKMMK
jgi:hypothetical protein